MSVLPGLVGDVEDLILSTSPLSRAMFSLTCRRAYEKYFLKTTWKNNGILVAAIKEHDMRLLKFGLEALSIVPGLAEPVLALFEPMPYPLEGLWTFEFIHFIYNTWSRLPELPNFGSFVFHLGATLTETTLSSEAARKFVLSTFGPDLAMDDSVPNHELIRMQFTQFLDGVSAGGSLSALESLHSSYQYEMQYYIYPAILCFDNVENLVFLYHHPINSAVLGFDHDNGMWLLYYARKLLEPKVPLLGGARVLEYIFRVPFREVEPETQDEFIASIYSKAFFEKIGYYSNTLLFEVVASKFPWQSFGVNPDRLLELSLGALKASFLGPSNPLPKQIRSDCTVFPNPGSPFDIPPPSSAIFNLLVRKKFLDPIALDSGALFKEVWSSIPPHGLNSVPVPLICKLLRADKYFELHSVEEIQTLFAGISREEHPALLATLERFGLKL